MTRFANTLAQAFPGRPDMILGALSGFAVAMVFGGPILDGFAGVWRDLILPAFYNLSLTGLPFCG